MEKVNRQKVMHTRSRELLLGVRQGKEERTMDDLTLKHGTGSASHEKSKAQKMKKEPINECCYRNQHTSDTISPESRFQHFYNPTDSSMLQPVVSMEHHDTVWALSNMSSSSENVRCPQHRRQSLEKLFLDFESVRLSKEDEDSASDLSDSERVPIPPSPLTPPKLNLRAEEINPGYFSQYTEHKCNDYEYPDFLPPPYNSWNLHQVSMYVHTEGKNTLQSTASAPLERYVDRLLQFEMFQMQTVQSEKAKMGKSRPQTVPATSRNGKSPGKCKPWPSPLPSKYLSNTDIVTKTRAGHDKNYYKKYTHRETGGAMCLRKSCSKVPGTMEMPAPNQTQDLRCKKKSVTNCQQTKDVLGNDSRMQCSGNIRPQRQSSVSSSVESIPKQTRTSKMKRSELTINSHGTSRHCISERKK